MDLDPSFIRIHLTAIFFFKFFKGFPRILRRSEARFFCFFGRATRAQVSTSKRRKRRDFPMDLDPSFIRIHLTTIFFFFFFFEFFNGFPRILRCSLGSLKSSKEYYYEPVEQRSRVVRCTLAKIKTISSLMSRNK